MTGRAFHVASTGFAFAACLAAGCAFDVIHVEQTPAPLIASATAKTPLVIQQDVPVELGFGYRRVLRKGTHWTYVGTIAKGDVYKTGDQVLTVEASNIYEAYIVVADGKLVGFYLPVEKTYTSVIESKSLPIVEAK